jgi:hypothetical protein
MLRLIEPRRTALPTPVGAAEVESRPAAELVTLPPRAVELTAAPVLAARPVRRPVSNRPPVAALMALVGGMAVSGLAGLALADLLLPLVLSAAGVLAAVVACVAGLGAVTGGQCPGVHCGGCGR